MSLFGCGITVVAFFGILVPASGEYGVLGCHSFQQNFTGIFREYVSVSESQYRSLYRQWNSFCVGLNKSIPHSSDEVRLAWSRYTTFRPLSSCELHMERPQQPDLMSTTHAPTPAPASAHEVSTLASSDLVGAKAISICPCLVATAPDLPLPDDPERDLQDAGDKGNNNDSSGKIWRLCFDVAEISGVLLLAVYAVSRRVVARYAVRRTEEHGNTFPEPLFNHRDSPKLWRSVSA